MKFLDTILSWIFPAKCAACGRSGAFLCAECLKSCPAAERESAKWIFPLYDYRHPAVKKSLRLFKYKGKKRLAEVFAEILYDRMLEELSELGIMENFRSPLLVPIPLSRKRLRERGYNQAELICLELLKINGLRGKSDGSFGGVDLELRSDVLIKPKDTEHQARIQDRRERLKNMRGTFAIKNGQAIKDRNVILIDDILTTGATLSEARRALRDRGARKVIAFTVAH